MGTEANAKIVASVLGAKICSISCRASCSASVYLEETVEFDRFFQIDRATWRFFYIGHKYPYFILLLSILTLIYV